MPTNRRSKQDRTKALAALFREAGWTRHGADWYIEHSNVSWSASLSVVRRDDGDLYDVSFAAGLSPSNEWQPIVNQGMGRLPAASLSIYAAEDSEAQDPLVADTRLVLIPLVSRLTSAEAVIDAWIDGELGWKGTPMSIRIAKRMAPR